MPLDVWTVGFSGHSDVHSRELPLDVWTVGFSGHSDVHSRELLFDLFQAIQMFIAENCSLTCFRPFRCLWLGSVTCWMWR